MQCLQVTIVRGISSDQAQRIVLRAGGVLRIGREAASEVQIDLNGVSGVHAELSLQAAATGGDADQALALCICDRSKNGTAIRAGPRVLGSGWTGKSCPAWERLTSGTPRSLPHGWQLLVPAKSRKGDQQIPMVQRLLTVFTEPVEEPAVVAQAAPEEAAAPAALPVAESQPEADTANAAERARLEMEELERQKRQLLEEQQLRAAQVAGAEATPLTQEEKERRRRERKEKRKAEKRAAGMLQAPQAATAVVAGTAEPQASQATAVQRRERERKKRLRTEEGQAVTTAPAPIPISALGSAGTPPPVPEDRRVAQAGAVEEDIARQEAERAKATGEDGVAEDVARTARPKRRARAPGQHPSTTSAVGPGAGDEDSEQSDVPDELSGIEVAALRKELGTQPPGDAAAGPPSATAAMTEAALAEEKVRAAAAAAASRKAAARAAAKENAAAAAAAAAAAGATAGEPPAKKPRTKARRPPVPSPERVVSETPERPQVSAPLTAAAVATLPSDIPLFELRSVSPISAPGITPKKRTRRKNIGPGESEDPGRRNRKRETRREAGKQLRATAATGSRRAMLSRGQYQNPYAAAGAPSDSDDAAAPEPEHLPDRWAPSPSPAVGVTASSSKRATAAAISSRVPAIPPAGTGGTKRSRSRGKNKRRTRSDDDKQTDKMRPRSRDRRRQQREIAAAAALAGEPVVSRRRR